MSKTTTQLADAVLRELGVVDAEETPDTVDRNYVISIYEDVYQELAAPGVELVYWQTGNNIPEAVFRGLRDLVMLHCQGAFGEPLDPAEKDARQQALLRPLRRHTMVERSGLPTMAEYI